MIKLVRIVDELRTRPIATVHRGYKGIEDKTIFLLRELAT